MSCDPSVPASPVGLAYADCFAQTVDYAARSAVYFGPKTAVVDVERGAAGRFDYTTLNDRATRLGHFLRSRGVGRGDRVGLLGQNGVEYIDLVLACAKLGAVFAPYNYRLHPSELLELVAKTRPKAFVYGPADHDDPRAVARRRNAVVHTPMFHTGGLLVYAVPLLLLGGRAVIMRRWDVERMLGLIERERVSMFFCVPTQYQMMLQSPQLAKTSFDSVRFVTSGGAPLPVPVLEAFRQIHDIPFKQGFGMTEFGPGVFSMGPSLRRPRRARLAGRTRLWRRRWWMRTIDRCRRGSGRAVSARTGDVFGLLQPARGHAAVIDADGWFHTGDMARVDSEGFYYIVDRKKDMFISGGENVYPVEIERVLYQHPAVHQCAVIGIADEKWGQVGRAYVVRKPSASQSSFESPEAEAHAFEHELLDFLRARLARYKVPKSVRVIAEMPLSPAGKILKRRDVQPHLGPHPVVG
jgi:acyl-CoA synthetase (AMP-forming)/AMP-acid ligase II